MYLDALDQVILSSRVSKFESCNAVMQSHHDAVVSALVVGVNDEIANIFKV